MFRLRSAVVPVILAPFILAGCPHPPVEGPPVVLPPRGGAPIRVSADPWVLSTDTWEADSRGAYLGNGTLGQRLMQAGLARPGEAADAAYMAGLYLNESLVTLPPLLPLRIEVAGKAYGADPARLRKYRQEMRLREGLLATAVTWDGGAGEVTLDLTAAVLKQRAGTALLRVKVANQGRAPVSFTTPAPGLAAPAAPGTDASNEWQVTEQGAYGSSRLSYSRSLMDLSAGRPADRAGDQSQSLAVAPGSTADVVLVTQVSGPGLGHEPLPCPNAALVDRWLADHRAAWGKAWRHDIEIEGDAEAQQAVRACLYQLLSTIGSRGAPGVPPMGQSAAAFNGHVFWDMDSWMLPALLPQHPELARAMLEYRFATLPGARANAKADGLPGASFAWESAATGRETLTSDIFRHGRHVTGDVALAARQYYAATQDRRWLREHAWPALQGTADNWVARARPDGRGGYVVRDVATPDETAGLVDHSAWTHHVAQVNLRFAAHAAQLLRQPGRPEWEKVAAGLGFLRDPATKLILPYKGFKETTRAKQADVLLLVHPGDVDLSEAELGAMYDYYAPRVIDTGPAMTDAIHAVVAARLGRGEEALARFRKSYRPFVRPPFMLFSEKRTRDNLVFLTGAAGTVEAVLYGFGGLRLSPDPARPDRPIMRSHLPPGWAALRVKGLRWRGRGWDVEMKPGTAPLWSPAP